MGGGYYDGDVAERTRSSRRDAFKYQGSEAELKECHASLDPKGKRRECRDSKQHPNTTPIVVAMDTTRSRGDDAKVIFGKLPMFFGQIKMNNYVPDPEICFLGIGDAKAGDKAPLQVAQFESDNRLDETLTNIWLEGGGGGTGQESYELAAYFLARRTDLDATARGQKGFCFILGDEGYYPKVSRAEIKRLIGDDLPADLNSAEIFRELQERYNVFFIYPKKSWQERRKDIDEEMRARLEEAGGRFRDVDIRASLRWDTFDDLDLHCVCPGGEIYFGRKSCARGELDVDRNAGGPQTRKPVENIRWAKNEAPPGRYRVFVRTYAFWERNPKPVPFRVELEVNGKIQTFEGTASPKLETGDRSDITAFEFTYDPDERKVIAADADLYAGYDDETILEQWASVIPRENILRIDDPRGIVDVMLGVLALSSGTELDAYVNTMKKREQTAERRTDTRRALSGLSDARTVGETEADVPKGRTGKKGKTKKL